MKKKMLILFFIGMISVGWGQQTTQYSQWSFNQFVINPAIAGIKEGVQVRTALRTQWLGLDNAPVSGIFTIHAPIKDNKRRLDVVSHGIGGIVEGDFFGPFTNISASLAYGLHFHLGPRRNHNLSFGLSLGVQQLSFNHMKVTTIHTDPAVNHSENRFLFPLLNAGAWYNGTLFYVGLTVEQLALNKWKNIGFTSRFRLHTKLAAGARFVFSNDNSFLPGVLFRIPPAGPVSIDINAMFDFKNRFRIGIGYRNIDAFIAFLRVRIQRFTIGYSFDYITSAIRGGNFHTHELGVKYSIYKHKNRRMSDVTPLFE